MEAVPKLFSGEATKSQKEIVVTGASRGIGKGIAEMLVSEGHHVIGVSRSQIPEISGLTQITCDLSEIDRLSSLWQQIVVHTDKIDTVILNAGMGHIHKIENECFANCLKVMNINFFSAYLLAKEAVLYWQSRKNSGHIIFVGSQAGLPGNGQAYNSLYSASKAAIHSLVGSLSRELGPNIRVNAIAPGDVMTELAMKSASKFVSLSGKFDTVEEYLAEISNRSILLRWVWPARLPKRSTT